MDSSDFAYQSTFIWKLTAQDGLLPVSNFTEEVKEDGDKKKSKAGQTSSKNHNKEQLGEISHFDNEDNDDEGNESDQECEEDIDGGKKDEVQHEIGSEEHSKIKEMQKYLAPGNYIYLANRRQYGIIRSKVSDTEFLVKVKRSPISGTNKLGVSPSLGADFEEIQVHLVNDEVRIEVEIAIRVVISEENIFTLKLIRPANDQMKTLAEDVGELLNLTRYEITFFYKNETIGLNERIGDREIGSINFEEDLIKNYLLCLKGGAQAPK